MKLEVPDHKLKCPVCDEKFISHKSLYGHMKNHRGMRPPISGSIPLEKLDAFLPGWSKTGRRTGPGKCNNFPVLGNGKHAQDQNLPPKKRKLKNNTKITNPGKNSNSTPFYDANIRALKPHICDICKRCFKSYQALGGHKAHHTSKSEKVVFAGEDNEFSTKIVDTDQEHKCSFCSKVFSKGQALGGHKRHCRSKERKNRPRVSSFDLNELPCE